MTTAASPSKSFVLDDRILAYLETGGGPLAIIIHGVGGHKEDWIAVAEALGGKRRVVAVDMLGFGGSSKSGEDLSIPVQAAALEALMDHLGQVSADIVGNSVGGWVAAAFAAAYPDRVRSLTLIDVAGFKAMFEGAPPVNFDPNDADEMQKLIDITINSDVAKTPGLAERAFEAYVSSGEKAVSGVWGRSIYGSPRLEELLPKITAKTLVLWGEDDRLFPSLLAGVFANQIAGAKAELIPNAGHFPQIDNPSATIAALEAFIA